MATKLVSNDIAGNVKPCFASSPIAGLTVRCNGEERTKVLDMNGNMVDAEFPVGPAPVLEDQSEAVEEISGSNGVISTLNLLRLVDTVANAFTVEMEGWTIVVGIHVTVIAHYISSSEIELPASLGGAATGIVWRVLPPGTVIEPVSGSNGIIGIGTPDAFRDEVANAFTADMVGRQLQVQGPDIVGTFTSVIKQFISTSRIKVTVGAPVAAGSTGYSWVVVPQEAFSSETKWVAYAYVYAATSKYPYVENDVAIGGSLAPRGHPSPATSIQIGGAKLKVEVTATPSLREDLDQIWFFRTAFFTTQEEAETRAAAGHMYFLGAKPMDDPVWIDENEVEGGDQVEIDNFGVPTFQFVIYSDPYWWGWGNYPLSVQGTWDTAGVLTLTDGTKWFDGRNGQYVRLEDVFEGGIGDNGLWLFKWIDATHAQLTNLDGTDAALVAAGAGGIVIQGPPTTLFRSKPRNPFSWGWTDILPTGARIAQTYAFKVGGGLGTAIASIPNLPTLLLSTEYPAGSFTLDLRRAGENGPFEKSLRTISNFYSITSHFSQFPATLANDNVVLWGWDAKNYCIVATDGNSIQPISQPIAKTLRQMSATRSRQIIAHGAYDAKNRMNCLWLPSQNAGAQVNFLVAQHAPTGQWFTHDDMDVLCSAQFQDGDTNLSKIYVGTETGFLGEAFAEGFYSNWISSGRSAGTIGSATATTIVRNDGIEFFLDRDGYVGNWCLITDNNGGKEQWGRISAVTANSLTFDYIRPAVGGATNAFNPIPTSGSLFFVGMIECRALKYFDFSSPAEDKKASEIWLSLDGVDVAKLAGHTGSTFLRYYRDRKTTPIAPLQDGKTAIKLNPIEYNDLEKLQKWFTQAPPSEMIKTFGVEVIDRGFGQWRFYNWTIKVVQ